MAETIIQDIIKSIDEAIAGFQGKVPGIQSRVFDELQNMVQQLATRDGKILTSTENLKLIANIKNKIGRILVDQDYKQAVADFTSSYERITALQNSYFAAFNAGFKPKKTLKIIQEVSVDATLNSLLDSGISSNVIDKVGDILRNNITGGGSIASLANQLRDHILTNESGAGSLERYTTQITTDALNQYTAQYQQAVAADLGFNWGRYVGSNLKTTREFCEYLTKKQWIHRTELPLIIKGDIDGHQCKLGKNGLPLGMIPGTNEDNFQVYRGGYNCGHQFFYVPDSVVPKDVLERKANPVKGSEPLEETKHVDLPKLEQFVQGIDQGTFRKLKTKIGLMVSKGVGGFYNPASEIIALDPNRSKTNFQRQTVTYHEFGHAVHYQNNIITFSEVSQEFKAVFDKARKAIAPKMPDIEKAMKERLIEIMLKKPGVDLLGHDSVQDLTESYGIAYDMLGALSLGNYGGGHQKKYYRNNNGSYMELFAHGNTLHFMSNTVVEKFLPEVAGILKEYFAGLYR